jgi:hypothetical protein
MVGRKVVETRRGWAEARQMVDDGGEVRSGSKIRCNECETVALRDFWTEEGRKSLLVKKRTA